MPGYFTNARSLVLGGRNHSADHSHPARVHRELRVRRPAAAGRPAQARGTRNPARRHAGRRGDVAGAPAAEVPSPPGSRAPGAASARHSPAAPSDDCDVIVATFDELDAFGVERPARQDGDHRRASPTTRLAELAAKDVDMVLDSTPQPFDVTVNAAVLEAMMMAVVVQPARAADQRRPARHDRLRRPGAPAALPQRVPAQEPVRLRHPPAVAEVTSPRWSRCASIEKYAPSLVMDGVEKGVAYTPPFDLQPRHRHHVPHRRRGRGLAHHRRRARPRS